MKGIGQQFGSGPFNTLHKPNHNLRASELDAMAKALTRCRGVNCDVYLDLDGGLVVSVDESTGSSDRSFPGKAYSPSGVLADGLTDSTKPWVKYALSTGAISEEIGPPSEPWGTNEIWRKKSDFAGAIYF